MRPRIRLVISEEAMRELKLRALAMQADVDQSVAAAQEVADRLTRQERT